MKIPTTNISKERYIEAITAADKLYRETSESCLHGMLTLGKMLIYVRLAGYSDITLEDLQYWNHGYGGDV